MPINPNNMVVIRKLIVGHDDLYQLRTYCIILGLGARKCAEIATYLITTPCSLEGLLIMRSSKTTQVN